MATTIGPAGGMILAATASWLAVSAVVPDETAAAVGYGMLGPLVAAVGSWIAMVRAARIDVARVSGVLLQGFAAKMLFFGAYVVLVVRGAGVDPSPFAMSFTTYFLVLLVTEALLLRRLTATVSGSAQPSAPRA